MSYSRKDRERAELLARALEDQGWSVFWDRALQAGDSFDHVLAEELGSASAVVVLWSPRSVASDWVLDEAQHAKDRGVLVPVLIDGVVLPLGFGRIQTADLLTWNGEPQHPGLIELDQVLAKIVGQRPSGPESQLGRQATTTPLVVEPGVARLPEPRRLLAVAAGAMVVLALGIGLLIASRGNNETGPNTTETAEKTETTSKPEGSSTTPGDTNPSTAPAAVSTARPVETDPSDSSSRELLLPSATGMAHVTINEPVIGYREYASVPDPERYRPEQTLQEAMDFYIDTRSTSNAFFREWLIYEAGNDLDHWLALSPQAWIDAAEGGFPTYPDGKKSEPVVGVSLESATAYCFYVNKRLITEIEWELAADGGMFEPDSVEVQNWVDSPADYGPVEPGSLVLRGSFGEEQDLHYRTIAPDSPVFRSFAGIRCASDLTRPEREVVSGGETFYTDDFTDPSTGWPSTPSDGASSVGYHPTDVFHVETERANTQVMVVGPEPAPANSTVATEVELRKPADGFGLFRYGVVARASDQGYLVLTVWPELEGEKRYVNWCLAQANEPLLGPDERVGSRTSGAFTTTCPDKLDEGRQEIQTFSTRLSLTVTGTTPAVTIDDSEVDLVRGITVDLSAGRFGFYVESFGEDRVAHLHYDGLVVTSR